MGTITNQDFNPGDDGSRRIGIGFVVAIHAIVGWGLASGLGNEMVAAIKKPLEAVVLQDVVLPPPPPPALPPKPQEPPKQVVQQRVEAPELQSSPTVPLAPVFIGPPPEVPPAKTGMTVACLMLANPVVPPRALRVGISGPVRTQATIVVGGLSGVEILSGPRLLRAAVRDAMQKYRCTAPDGTVAVQAFDFSVE